MRAEEKAWDEYMKFRRDINILHGYYDAVKFDKTIKSVIKLAVREAKREVKKDLLFLIRQEQDKSNVFNPALCLSKVMKSLGKEK